MTGASGAALVARPAATRGPLPWLWCALLVVGAIGVMLPLLTRPAFGPVDDHQLFLIHGQISGEGWLPVLASYIAESSARFRPLYWIGQLGELAAWGLNPAGWYLDRALLLTGSLLLSVWAFRPFMPMWAAVLGTVVAFAGPQVEPWVRLGPQEAYAVPLTLAALGCVAGSRYRTGIALAVLAALTKEIFLASSLAISALAWHRGHRPWIGLAALACIGAAIVAVTVTRHDPYVASRFGSLLAEPRYWWPWAIGIGFAVGWGVAQLARRSRPAAIVAVVGLLIVVESQGVAALAVANHWTTRVNAWTAGIEQLHGPLVVVADNTGEYEAVVALRRFVPDGAASLEFRGDAEPTSPLEASLWTDLRRWADEGGVGYAPGVFGDCTAVMFVPGPSPCPTTVVISLTGR